MWYTIITIWFGFLVLIYGRIYWVNRKETIIFKYSDANDILKILSKYPIMNHIDLDNINFETRIIYR